MLCIINHIRILKWYKWFSKWIFNLLLDVSSLRSQNNFSTKLLVRFLKTVEGVELWFLRVLLQRIFRYAKYWFDVEVDFVQKRICLHSYWTANPKNCKDIWCICDNVYYCCIFVLYFMSVRIICGWFWLFYSHFKYQF